jgi:sugar/nucleoside kinase (ribokinase family)
VQNRRPGLVRVHRSPQPSLLAVGDLMLDVVVVPERPPERGTDVPGRVVLRAGGSAFNVCRAFARLGGRATLVCAIGSDGLGRRLIAAARSDGVAVRAAEVKATTGRLAALVGADGERSFVTQRAGADLLRPQDLRETWFRRWGVLHLPVYSLLTEPLADAAVRAVALTRASGGLVSVDLSSAAPIRTFGASRARERIGELAVDLLLATRVEAAALVGSGSSRLLRLLDLAPVVVVKEGAEGSRLLRREASGLATEARLEAATTPMVGVETTGAGDAFAAGLLYALLRAGGPPWSPAATRRATLAGHRAASVWLRSPRRELDL